MNNLYSTRGKELAKKAKHKLTLELKSQMEQEGQSLKDQNIRIFRRRINFNDRPLEFWGKIVAKEKSSTQLTSLYYSGEFELAVCAFLEGMSVLTTSKNRISLAKLAPREIESYLRDQNHLPALFSPEEKNLPTWCTQIMAVIPLIIEEMLLLEGETSDISFDVSLVPPLFKGLSLPEKLLVIENFFNQKLRPGLKQDGGNVVIKAIEEENNLAKIYLHFEGQCQECPSSKKGTWQFIENYLLKYFAGQVLAHPF